MLRNVNSIEDRAFWYICKCSLSLEGFPVSGKEVARFIGCSYYAALKAMHTLCGMGLIEKRSVGIPAFEGSGEYHDDWYDSQPPKNGFALTEKGRNTTEYKRADVLQLEEYARWANGEHDGDGADISGDLDTHTASGVLY